MCLQRIADIQRIGLLQNNIGGLQESLLTQDQRVIHLDKLKYRTSGSSGGWKMANVVLLTDRLLILREKNNDDGRMYIRKNMLLSETIFSALRMRSGQIYPGFGLTQCGYSEIEMQLLTNESFLFWRRQLKQFAKQQVDKGRNTLHQYHKCGGIIVCS
ncbi:hypothetical protein THASP1DRAFT_33280 [Thamnocephalis sphaerospora]|uniref:PH domain-containing protein n=1 Tax=Thamnocephalis sphaerospora TaxID=78915 RepID=A0A4P9XGY1_9FUNG|nr:hypothetical protein THASP1DRAFT_33280 [Thamnocephalis sphaerospora]|eukprot:RKP04903.1 hypothetical protein THASP1DRAFT_33280 [Thamnocephalis sphaerospora]